MGEIVGHAPIFLALLLNNQNNNNGNNPANNNANNGNGVFGTAVVHDRVTEAAYLRMLQLDKSKRRYEIFSTSYHVSHLVVDLDTI